MQLFAAVPAGLLTDKCRRDTVLRIAAGIGLVAGLTLAYCLFFSAPVWAFMIAMGLVGSYKGFNNPAIESIFADSVQRGKRYALPHSIVPTLAVTARHHLRSRGVLIPCLSSKHIKQ